MMITKGKYKNLARSHTIHDDCIFLKDMLTQNSLTHIQVMHILNSFLPLTSDAHLCKNDFNHTHPTIIHCISLDSQTHLTSYLSLLKAFF